MGNERKAGHRSGVGYLVVGRTEDGLGHRLEERIARRPDNWAEHWDWAEHRDWAVDRAADRAVDRAVDRADSPMGSEEQRQEGRPAQTSFALNSPSGFLFL